MAEGDSVQTSERSRTAGPGADPREGRGARPLVAFLVAGTLLAIMLGTYWLSRSDQGPTVEPIRNGPQISEPQPLTESEAIARFKKLDALRIDAYRNRDVSLLSTYVASRSPLLKLGRRDIRELRQERLIFMPSVHTRRVKVIANDSDEIVVRQTAIERVLFLDEEGDRIKPPTHLWLVVDWTLRHDDGNWKLFDSDVLRSKEIK